MEVIPAIDLRDGKCVRLTQGDYDRETVFSDDPIAVAERWVASGARRIHVVDLDGARDGVRANAAVVERIAREADVPLQVGGGIRTADDAAGLIDLGVDRVIFGTAAVESPAEVESAVARLGPEHVVVGLDARDGLISTRGWLENTGLSALDLVQDMAARGVTRYLHTDVGRDGTLTGPNVDAIEDILSNVRISLVAAGGFAELSHLAEVAKIGVEAVVIGTAIYTGAIDFEDAVSKF
ncbi:MAG: 1-(5-phosphoribosyl)-5-[(5-phosphoribosylamino)methylideneamino]imidazole-4-carboxamide isomerase [Chloroflexi bacterium]|nr:1-(5-phosphoribosyl)-5-[(5-phosphoribosylamino)methylideneamino]imidazole-4-carboxamide isomerase [Chloroflexota bacterium]